MDSSVGGSSIFQGGVCAGVPCLCGAEVGGTLGCDGEVHDAFVIGSQEMYANSINIFVVSDIEEMATKSLCWSILV